MTTTPLLIRCGACGVLNRIPDNRLQEHPLCGSCKSPLDIPRAPVQGNASSFERELATWPETVLVEFWAKWCGYCRMIEPVVNDLASWRAGRLKIIRIDVDEQQDLSRRFGIRATPTFILFRKGKSISRMDGAPKEKMELVRWVDQHLAAS